MGLPFTKPCTVYAIRCEKNSKVYVGVTQNLPHRLRAHWNELKKGYKGNMRDPSFQQDFDHYGQDCFKAYVLEEAVPPENAELREAFWIKEYRATNPLYGYNKLNGDPPPIFEIVAGLPPKPVDPF